MGKTVCHVLQIILLFSDVPLPLQKSLPFKYLNLRFEFFKTFFVLQKPKCWCGLPPVIVVMSKPYQRQTVKYILMLILHKSLV